MVARGSGWVINVSSLAGVTPLRGCSYYGAAKAGLAHASEIARIELAPRGVRVLTVYPGPVRSGLERRARDQFAQSRARDWIPTGDPEPLARAVLRAVERGAARVVYPRIYGVANRAPRIAGFITARISPEPRS
jgi:2-hydroxycyclohexanecarboxyl-CoA dehydrogenase